MIHTFKSISITTKCVRHIDGCERIRVVLCFFNTRICRIHLNNGVISMPNTQTHSRFSNLISLTLSSFSHLYRVMRVDVSSYACVCAVVCVVDVGFYIKHFPNVIH